MNATRRLVTFLSVIALALGLASVVPASSAYANSAPKQDHVISFTDPGDQTLLAAGSVPNDYDKITDMAVGESPFEMISADGYVYTVEQRTGTLSQIEAATNTLIETVDIGSSRDGSSFLTAHNDKVYISAISRDRIKIVDFSTSPATVTTLSHSLIDDPRAITVTDTHAYVVQYNGPTSGDDNLIRVDLSTNEVKSCASSADLREGWEITTQGRYGYITHPNRNLITKVDLLTCTVIQELWHLTEPAINVVAHNNRLYTANYNSWGSGNGTTIDVIDLDTFSVMDTWTGFSGPQGLAVSGNRLFVSNVTTSEVSVRNLNNGNEVASFPVASTSRYVTTSGSTLYVVSQATNEVSAFYIGAQAPGGVTLTATSSSTLPVSYVSTTADVCTVSGPEVSFVAGGTCMITAFQVGNETYNPAPDITRSFSIAKLPHEIDFARPADVEWGSDPVTLSATASSGLEVSYSSGTTGVCTVSDGVVSHVAPGTCEITASHAGTAVYQAAVDMVQSFVIGKMAHEIYFPKPADVEWGSDPVTLSATASSGLEVSYSSQTTDVCTVSDGVVSHVAAGACEITASHAGTAVYQAAADVVRSFEITEPRSPDPTTPPTPQQPSSPAGPQRPSSPSGPQQPGLGSPPSVPAPPQTDEAPTVTAPNLAPPGPVVKLRGKRLVEKRNASYGMKFLRPRFDGGSPITGYSWRIKVTGKKARDIGTSHSWTNWRTMTTDPQEKRMRHPLKLRRKLGDLPDGVRIHVQVHAVNDVGAGKNRKATMRYRSGPVTLPANG